MRVAPEEKSSARVGPQTFVTLGRQATSVLTRIDTESPWSAGWPDLNR